MRLDLLPPTGVNQVGSRQIHLVDSNRRDPWSSTSTRELMTTVFYPAVRTKGCQRAPYMSPAAAEVFKQLDAGLLHPELPSSGVDWAATRTHSYSDAPAKPGKWPVVIYSPGGADPRTVGTSLAEELASHGYVVVTVDHPGETSEVEFPGGRLRTIELPPDAQTNPEVARKMMTTRFADIRFLLDHLPVGVDLNRIGIYGHSAGGGTAAEALYQHPRIRAAANLEGYLDHLDGELFKIVQHGTDRPLLLAGTDGFRDDRFDRTWSKVRARRVQLEQANHWVFTDYAAFAPQLQRAGLVTDAGRASLVGTNPCSVQLVRSLVREFFDRHL